MKIRGLSDWLLVIGIVAWIVLMILTAYVLVLTIMVS